MKGFHDFPHGIQHGNYDRYSDKYKRDHHGRHDDRYKRDPFFIKGHDGGNIDSHKDYEDDVLKK